MIRLRALNPKDRSELPHDFDVVPELIGGVEECVGPLGQRGAVVWWGTPGGPLMSTLVADSPDQIATLARAHAEQVSS